jgi:hypothetical protein
MRSRRRPVRRRRTSFRSRVVMAAPRLRPAANTSTSAIRCRTSWRGCATIALPAPGGDRQPLESGHGHRRALSAAARRITWRAAMRPARPGHAAAAALWAGRLQLPAPGPVRRACLSAAGRDPAVAAGARLRGRRTRADRAAAAHAVAADGGAAAPGRRGGLRGAPSAGAGQRAALPRQHAARREHGCAAAQRHTLGIDFSRRRSERRARAAKEIADLVFDEAKARLCVHW